MSKTKIEERKELININKKEIVLILQNGEKIEELALRVKDISEQFNREAKVSTGAERSKTKSNAAKFRTAKSLVLEGKKASKADVLEKGRAIDKNFNILANALVDGYIVSREKLTEYEDIEKQRKIREKNIIDSITNASLAVRGLDGKKLSLSELEANKSILSKIEISIEDFKKKSIGKANATLLNAITENEKLISNEVSRLEEEKRLEIERIEAEKEEKRLEKEELKKQAQIKAEKKFQKELKRKEREVIEQQLLKKLAKKEAAQAIIDKDIAEKRAKKQAIINDQLRIEAAKEEKRQAAIREKLRQKAEEEEKKQAIANHKLRIEAEAEAKRKRAEQAEKSRIAMQEQKERNAVNLEIAKKAAAKEEKQRQAAARENKRLKEEERKEQLKKDKAFIIAKLTETKQALLLEIPHLSEAQARAVILSVKNKLIPNLSLNIFD